jgi:hypothetical protein
MPQTIAIDEVKVGMILSADVINPQGLVLIKKDIQLTDKHIKVLKRWGITSIAIADFSDAAADTRPTAEIVQEKLAEIAAQLESRFTGCEHSEIMMSIKSCVQEYRAERIKQKFGEK